MHSHPLARARCLFGAARRICRLVAVLPALTVTQAAVGAEPAWHIGVGAGIDRGRVECLAGFACDRSDSAWKAFAGRRLLDTVELQVAWFDAGTFEGADTAPLGTEFGGDFKVRGVAFTVGHRWKLSPEWSVAARAGAARVRTRFVYADSVWGDASKTTTQPYASVGIAYALTPAMRIGVDYDVTLFKANRRAGSLQMLGATAQFSF